MRIVTVRFPLLRLACAAFSNWLSCRGCHSYMAARTLLPGQLSAGGRCGVQSKLGTRISPLTLSSASSIDERGTTLTYKLSSGCCCNPFLLPFLDRRPGPAAAGSGCAGTLKTSACCKLHIQHATVSQDQAQNTLQSEEGLRVFEHVQVAEGLPIACAPLSCTEWSATTMCIARRSPHVLCHYPTVS